MTAHRRPEIRFSDAPRATCRWCGDPIVYDDGPKRGEPDRRRRWHPECVEAYNASDPREARRRLRKRDRGRCAACGLDTVALKRALRGRGMAKALRKRGFVPRRSLWEVDHIVPLIDGGCHALDNLQTLCTPCHKEKTAAEASERAARARADAAHESPSESESGSEAEQKNRSDEGVDATPADGRCAAPAPGGDASEAPRPPDPVKDTEKRPARASRRARSRAPAERPLAELLAHAGELNSRVESALRGLRDRT